MGLSLKAIVEYRRFSENVDDLSYLENSERKCKNGDYGAPDSPNSSERSAAKQCYSDSLLRLWVLRAVVANPCRSVTMQGVPTPFLRGLHRQFSIVLTRTSSKFCGADIS